MARKFKYKKVTQLFAREHFRGTLTYRQKQRLPDSDFVFPKERKYPIYNEAHARNALARVSAYGSDYEKEKVCNAVEKKYPSIHAESCMQHG